MNIDNKLKNELFKALFYLKISELKQICKNLQIPCKGEKIVLIENIKYFIDTGKIKEQKIIPDISRAKSKIKLSPDSLILFGSYKNDLNTRNFFKKIIGDHFHFTAFGQDWIKDRWLQGHPPTYGEFANFWQKEYLRRKTTKANMKEEWAYLNFLSQYKIKRPNASKNEAIKAWKQYRNQQVDNVENILSNIFGRNVLE